LRQVYTVVDTHPLLDETENPQKISAISMHIDERWALDMK
jgi:hypothetical protein